MTSNWLRFLVALLALSVAALSLYRLELARAGIDIDRMAFGDTPVTIYTPQERRDGLVIVSHGFAGSRQMMNAISVTLARAGQTVVAFDYHGHGRHKVPLSPEVDTLTGTTEDLVAQTLSVAELARARSGQTSVSFVGHSMATDVIIRAARRFDAAGAVAAISMYSDAIEPKHPKRLLIVSGALEGRLRGVALDAVAQIGPRQEGETVEANDVTRRAVVAPYVGHVGVLWSPATATEIAAWLGDPAQPARTGPWIAALLLAIVALFWPLSRFLPDREITPAASLRRATVAALLPAPAAALAASTGLPLGGLTGFGSLALGFAVWGALALAILRMPLRPSVRDLAPALLLVSWGLAVFALALDRYGAAFLPTGPRLPLMVLLLPATLIFALADRALVHGRGILGRMFLRAPFLVALSAAMVAQPTSLGLLFTVVPVLILFFLVYGTMAAWAARRSGPMGPGTGSGIILAWAVAASTPLFST